MSTCGSCKNAFSEGSVITPCICCFRLFHSTSECTKVSQSEVKVLVLKTIQPLLVFRCNECTQAGGVSAVICDTLKGLKDLGDCLTSSCDSIKEIHQDFLNVKTQVDVLSTEVPALREDLSLLQQKVSEQPSLDEIDCEIEDRLSRRNNLIFYGVPETNPVNSQQDLVKIKSMLSKLNNINLNDLTAHRRGKLPANKPRPLAVQLKSRDEVFRIIKQKDKLPSSIQVSTDKTKKQRESIKKMWILVDEHNQAHPNDLKTVRHINKIPTIVLKELPKTN